MAAPMVQTPTAPSKPRRPYDPGWPGECVKVSPNVYRVASWKNSRSSYLVDLGRRPSCNCQHFQHANRPKIGVMIEQEVVECKHIRQARAAQAESFRLNCGRLTDDELTRARAMYESAGRFDIAFACMVEQYDREQVAR